jgi:hypothetical protein
MAVIQVITATTLNPSPDRKEAVGKNTKWNGKLSEPPPAPLSWISALAVKRQFAHGAARDRQVRQQVLGNLFSYR